MELNLQQSCFPSICLQPNNNKEYVRSNPRRISSWISMVKKIKDRLCSWKGRMLSLGERITLIKFVLSSLAIFHLSFFRAPKKVCQDQFDSKSLFVGWSRPEEENSLDRVEFLDFVARRRRYRAEKH